MNRFLFATCIGVAVLSAGCKDDDKPQTGTGGAPTATTSPDVPTPPATQPAETDDHPDAVPLGETTLNGLKLVATQDEPITPGGEGAFDLVITGGKPKAVRFWVGTESGEESVKAKADEETPDHWHTHVEVPDPLPPGSQFWAEVEPQTGDTVRVSFDLKQ